IVIEAEPHVQPVLLVASPRLGPMMTREPPPEAVAHLEHLDLPLRTGFWGARQLVRRREAGDTTSDDHDLASPCHRTTARPRSSGTRATRDRDRATPGTRGRDRTPASAADTRARRAVGRLPRERCSARRGPPRTRARRPRSLRPGTAARRSTRAPSTAHFAP